MMGLPEVSARPRGAAGATIHRGRSVEPRAACGYGCVRTVGGLGGEVESPIEPVVAGLGGELGSPIDPVVGGLGGEVVSPMDPVVAGLDGEAGSPMERVVGGFGGEAGSPMERVVGGFGGEVGSPIEPVVLGGGGGMTVELACARIITARIVPPCRLQSHIPGGISKGDASGTARGEPDFRRKFLP